MARSLALINQLVKICNSPTLVNSATLGDNLLPQEDQSRLPEVEGLVQKLLDDASDVDSVTSSGLCN